MSFKYFSLNGVVRPTEEATVPVSNIEYSYGFGVYETIRVTGRVTFFIDEHLERLMESARIIGLEHEFTPRAVETFISDLIAKNIVETCNLKILLIGATKKEDVQLFILCLNPLFPDKKMYRDGASFVTYDYERAFPHAKTLNMLQSYLAYCKAKQAGCYDALLVNRSGHITEGTRTNFFTIKDRTIFTPREHEILIGVTRTAVLKVAEQNGFTIQEQDISLGDIQKYDGAFITSTSSKIIPVRSIGAETLSEPPAALRELMQQFDKFLDSCGGKLR